MGSILTTIKIISFIFPFLKELFIGRGNAASRKVKTKEENALLKKIIIVIGCISVALNFYLVTRSYKLGREVVELKRKVNDVALAPVVCPRENPASRTSELRPTSIGSGINKERDPPKRKTVRPVAALPPEKESYLKELESINKIQ